MAFLVGGGLGLPGVVHGHEDGACLEEDGGKVMAQELGRLLLIGDVDAREGQERVDEDDVGLMLDDEVTQGGGEGRA
jgi:hypothetical protein